MEPSRAFSALQNPEVVTAIGKNRRGEPVFETDVVIIGNGPSGLSMSAFLGGWRPYYDLDAAHPNRKIHQIMSESTEQSLFDKDLSFLDEYELNSRSSHHLSALYDILVRPDADLGHEHPSALRWEKVEKSKIAHVVIGNEQPGGSWNNYDDDVVPLSLSSWLDLPGYSMGEWLGLQTLCTRLPCLVFRKYFGAYPKRVGIEKHFLSDATVTDVQKGCDENGSEYWEVNGVHATDGPFHFRSKKLVLATGMKEPRALEVPGEKGNDRVLHDLQPLKRVVENEAIQMDDTEENEAYCSLEPVIVVGDGITAADAVLYCLSKNIPVLHVFRRSQKEIKATNMGRLSKAVYPEYQSVVRLMIGRDKDDFYKPFPCSEIASIDHQTAWIKSSVKGEEERCYEFRKIAVCIGRKADLSFLGALADQSLEPNPITYESMAEKSLYVLGPLAGDNFVRFLVGGCLAAARHIFSLYKSQ